jgi:hypothetical protein
MNVGKPVNMNCKHGSTSHSGLAIYGDIDIIPDGIRSRWEVGHRIPRAPLLK